jgi:hypothetical protein
MLPNRRTVVALAGRLVDAPDTKPPRFPLGNVPLITDRVQALFAKLEPVALVCSAACGGDLIAIGVAEERGVDTEIILPFDIDRFENSSVDRPGGWKPCFRRAIEQAKSKHRLEILSPATPTNDAAYLAVTDRILERALALAGSAAGVVAVLVWEGAPRSEADQTWRLLRAAECAGARTVSISTLE